MRTAPGYVTLFVGGFGVEIEASRIEGTGLKSGDSVAHDFAEQLERFHTRKRHESNPNWGIF
jgi:hypothetical protein